MYFVQSGVSIMTRPGIYKFFVTLDIEPLHTFAYYCHSAKQLW